MIIEISMLYYRLCSLKSLTNLQAEINKQAEKGYKLHTISTSSSGSKGFLGGDKIQATMVFERID